MCACSERCEVFACIPQNEAVTSVHGGVPQKRVCKTQDVRDVNIFQLQ